MSDLDRMKGGLAAFVRALFPRIDHLAYYPAVVTAQNADGTLELTPDDTRLPGMSSVPIRLGVPGVTAKVSSGARVLLGFAAGDPSKPVASIWESGAVTELVIQATVIKLNDGNTPVAKEGSATTGHTHNFVATAGPFPVTPTVTLIATDTIATGAGSPTVKVP